MGDEGTPIQDWALLHGGSGGVILEGELMFLEGQGALQSSASKTVVVPELFRFLGLKLS